MTVYASFGEWVRRRRNELGLETWKVAQELGYSDSTLRKIENNTRRPSRHVAVRLAELLQIDAEQREEFVRLSRVKPIHRAKQQAESALPDDLVDFVPKLSTSLIGREQECSMVRRMLDTPSARLVTLTGPPGVGKTRLALELAARVRRDYPGGVWYVPLAPLRDATRVASVIARTLEVSDLGDDTLLEALAARVADQKLLLALDNFERVHPANTIIADLLTRCSRLTVLVTSRVALNIAFE